MNGWPTTLAANTEALAIIFGSMVVVFVVWIIFYTWQNVTQTKQRERTRREIAAYVAEGSIAPEDAGILLGLSPTVEASLASAISEGNLEADDVEKIVRAAVRGARAGGIAGA